MSIVRTLSNTVMDAIFGSRQADMGTSSDERRDNASSPPKKSGPAWRSCRTPEGHTYFWNAVTGEVTWDMPQGVEIVPHQPVSTVSPALTDQEHREQVLAWKRETKCHTSIPVVAEGYSRDAPYGATTIPRFSAQSPSRNQAAFNVCRSPKACSAVKANVFEIEPTSPSSLV